MVAAGLWRVTKAGVRVTVSVSQGWWTVRSCAGAIGGWRWRWGVDLTVEMRKLRSRRAGSRVVGVGMSVSETGAWETIGVDGGV